LQKSKGQERAEKGKGAQCWALGNKPNRSGSGEPDRFGVPYK